MGSRQGHRTDEWQLQVSIPGSQPPSAVAQEVWQGSVAGTGLTVEFQMPGAWVWFCLGKSSKVLSFEATRSDECFQEIILEVLYFILNLSTRNYICLPDSRHITACSGLLFKWVYLSHCVHTCMPYGRRLTEDGFSHEATGFMTTMTCIFHIPGQCWNKMGILRNKTTPSQTT